MANEQHKPALIIVGSTGLIGSHLVNHFAETYRVFAMDIKSPEDLPEGAEFISIDVTSDERVHDAMHEAASRSEGPIAAVIQLAAYYDFAGDPSELYDKITVEGTRRALRVAQEISAEQFIFSSTMLVHRATKPGRPFNEDRPLEAKWPYPQSKVKTEKLIRAEHGNLPAVLLRIAGAYTDVCDSLPLSHQIQRIREQRLTSKVYPGDTRCGQAFVHIDDLTEAFCKTVENRHLLPNDAFPILIGEPETPGYGQLQKEFARRILGVSDWETREIPKALAKSGAWLQENMPGVDDPFIKPFMVDLADDHYELDISRAQERINWSPKRRLLQTVPSMIENLRTDPEAWYRRHGLTSEGG